MLKSTIQKQYVSLQTEPELLDSVMEGMPFGLAWSSSTGQILGLNSIMAREVGISESQNVPSFLWDLFEEREYLKARIGLVLNGDRTEVQERVKLRHVASGRQWCKIKVTAISTQDAAVAATLVLQRLPEVAVPNSENQIPQGMQETLNTQLEEALFRANDHQGILYVNQRFLDLFGYSKVEDVMHQELGVFFASSVTLSQLFTQAQTARKVTRFPATFLRKDGSRFEGRMNLSLSDSENGVSYVTGSLLDITEFEQAKEELEGKKRQLEKLNTQLDGFLYSACHDLRSPITSMQGLLHLLELEPGQSKMTMEYLSRLKQSIYGLDSVTHDMITIAKNSHQQVQSKRVKFEALINEVLLSFQGFPAFDKLQFQIHVHDTVPFFTDVDRLRNVLEQLIKNTLFYYSKKVDDPFVKIEVMVRAECAFIEVIDNGEGIPKAHLDRVFDMFYRANDRSMGPGLGLYIARETLHKLGGEISIESELDNGTIVSLEVPNGIKGRLMSKKLKLYNEGLLEEPEEEPSKSPHSIQEP